jgi:hypothetical protein
MVVQRAKRQIFPTRTAEWVRDAGAVDRTPLTSSRLLTRSAGAGKSSPTEIFRAMLGWPICRQNPRFCSVSLRGSRDAARAQLQNGGNQPGASPPRKPFACRTAEFGQKLGNFARLARTRKTAILRDGRNGLWQRVPLCGPDAFDENSLPASCSLCRDSGTLWCWTGCCWTGSLPHERPRNEHRCTCNRGGTFLWPGHPGTKWRVHQASCMMLRAHVRCCLCRRLQC